MTCTYILHQLTWGHNHTAKVASDKQRIAYSSSITCENHKELLTSWVVFEVNRYESFMANKNMIRTFCGCKPSTFWINYKINEISKSKKVNNLWQKLSEHQNMKFIN